jgi:hypothetical protein
MTTWADVALLAVAGTLVLGAAWMWSCINLAWERLSLEKEQTPGAIDAEAVD